MSAKKEVLGENNQQAAEEMTGAKSSWEMLVQKYNEEQAERIEVLKIELKNYLHIPLTKGILLIKRYPHDFIVFHQKKLPIGKQRRVYRYGREELSNIVDNYSIVEFSETQEGCGHYVCLCRAYELGLTFSLQQGSKYKNRYEIVSHSSEICIIIQKIEEEKTKHSRKAKDIEAKSRVYTEKLMADFGEEDEECCCKDSNHGWQTPILGEYLTAADLVWDLQPDK